MRKIIVPVQALCSSIDFVAIRRDETICEIQFFAQTKPYPVGESRLSFGCSGKGTR